MARWQIAEELKPTDNRVVNVRKLVKAMPKNMAALFLERYNDVYHLGFDPESWIEPYRNETICKAPPWRQLQEWHVLTSFFCIRSES